MGREFNIDETDYSIGPEVKADACYEAAASSLAAGAGEAAKKLFVRAMQLYDMAERHDKVLICARALGIADPEKDKQLYINAARYYFQQGDHSMATSLVAEHGLDELVDEFGGDILLE